ncbi:MAG: DNA polymerase III subunit alpha [Elusimicrobiota bacterium]
MTTTSTGAKLEFVHLHNHSEYSLMDGLIRLSDRDGKPSETLKSLASRKTRALALTDHGNMYGAIEFYQHCSALGINPIIGCEMYISKGSRADRGHSQKENCHLTVLAKNAEGYRNLIRLSTLGFTEGYYYDPRIDKDLLAKHSRGLIVLSGCLKSEICQSISAGNLAQAEKLAAWFKDNLEPESFYLEIMDHGLEKQRQATSELLGIAKRTGIPLIATNDCHYAHKDDFEAHDARVCISTGRKIADTDRLRFESHEFHLKTPEEMHALFSFAPEALSNTLKIAQMCNIQIPLDQTILPNFDVPEGRTQDSYLEELCFSGLKERLGETIPLEYRERMSYEISVIRRMGFSAYFLIVWDFINYARSQNIPVGPGRGSGAGALVAYALKITSVDPLKHGLLFERFLNPDRKSMPDLDIDFADTGRDRIIDYVRRKYGADNVAQIITFGSLGAKLVIRDVGRVMGMAISDVDRIAKMIPVGPNISLYEAMKSPEMLEAAKNPQIKKLLALSLKLEGLKRHTGVHAAGTVITREPAINYVPLAKSPKSDVITTQYDGDVLPKLGLLKIDFLGLRTLSIIARAVESIQERKNPGFNMETVPMDDAKTFDLLRSAKALAVFQLDSQGMRDLLYRLKPTTFSDIVSLIALFRPGPMQSGMLDMFVDRKHGKKKVAYEHPFLEPILKDTYGCLVFQEQVMEISKTLAEFTPGQADGLRKAMGKKIPEELEKMRETFVKGAAKHKITAKLANKIYDQMVQFGGYGFNKSHSAAYGILAYQTAYLKANYPLEFMTAVLSSEIGHSAVDVEGKENKLVTYLGEAKDMGIAVLPPDAQKSVARFSIEDPNAIRFGLMAVKHVGESAAQAIVAARKPEPFRDFNDFCRRIDLHAVNRKAIEALIKSGALDGLGAGSSAAARGGLLAALDDAMERAASRRQDMDIGQGLLFEAFGPEPAPERGPESAPLSDSEVLKHEKEVLGFYFSGHPLLGVKDKLACTATHEIDKLGPDIQTPIRLAGMLVQVKRMITKSKGETMAKATLEDLSGEIQILIFPKAYASGLGDQIKAGQFVAATGRLSFRGESPGGKTEEQSREAPELIVDRIYPLDDALARFAKRIRILPGAKAGDPEALEALKNTLANHPGACHVLLEHRTSEGLAWLETDYSVRPEQNLLESIEKIFGDKSWRIESAS